MPSEETQCKVEDLRTIECSPLDMISSRARRMIPCTFNPRDFTEQLISAIIIAMENREDVDQWSDERKASRTILSLSSPDDPIVTSKYMEERKASSIASNERQKDSMIMESRHPNGGGHGLGVVSTHKH
jgi:hypothetical protein